MLLSLFSWIASLFRNDGADISLYAPRQRTIYRYFNGKDIVAADPMELYRKFADVATDLQVDLKVAFSESKFSDTGYKKSVEKIRSIFAVPTLAEGGMTDLEMFGLFNHFMDYCSTLKKNMPPSPTSPAGTSPDGPSLPVAVPITEPSSPTGSSASGPSSVPPELSPTASPPPSAASSPEGNTTNP